LLVVWGYKKFEMNIDRHNYEEFFILYVDNEMSSEDRRRVEAFVQLHPDLQEELDMLLQAKLEPDQQVVFANKEELMMFNGAPSSINENNYEEWLVLYTDNELDEEQRRVVEAYAGHHPAVQHELALLLQTRLEPDAIVFPDKNSLYRREEKTRRIGWWKIAAAAVLLAAIATTTAIIINKNNAVKPTSPGITSTTDQKIPAAKQEQATEMVQNDNSNKENKNGQPVDQTPVITPNDNNNNNALATVDTKESRDKKSVKQQTRKQQRVTVQEEEKPVIAAITNNSNQSTSIDDPVNAASNVNSKIIDEIFTTQTALTKSRDNHIIPAVTTIAPKTYNIRTTDTPEDFVQNDGKKSKLRGFLRKVTRTFEKNTRIDATDEDDRLLVGGLAIKL
jgi:hypothetical protein